MKVCSLGVGKLKLAACGAPGPYVGVDLALANAAIGDCAEQVEVGTTFKMACSP